MLLLVIFSCFYLAGAKISNFSFPLFNRNSSYVSLCDFPLLSLNSSAIDCLVMPSSLTRVKANYPFTMIMSKTTVIEPSFKQVMKKMNIKVHRYKEIPVPKEALKFHTAQGRPGWYKLYQKLNMFLLPFDRIVFLDSDMVFLKSIDEVFDRSMVAPAGKPDYEALYVQDCTPHGKGGKGGRGGECCSPTNPSQMGAISLLLPSTEMFNRVVAALKEGVSTESGAPTWKWKTSTQDLVPAVLRIGSLGCNLQTFPDVCLHGEYPPLSHYPLGERAAIHYTWGPKGSDLVKKPMKYFEMRRQEAVIPIPQSELKTREGCYRSMGEVFEKEVHHLMQMAGEV